MAEVPVGEQQPENAHEELKYLDFVHVAAIQVLVCFSKLYDIAKENSGPLKAGVETVEDTVKAVVGPVYEKLHDVPFELLKFVDRKVGDSVHELERHVPTMVRNASNQAYTMAQKAPEVARSMAEEVRHAGVMGTATSLTKVAVTKCEPTVKELYSKYEPVAKHYALWGWQMLNKLPVFPLVAQVVVPTAAHLSEKYNEAVCSGREKGYAVAAYLPPVPTEKISKMLSSAPVAASS